MKLFSVCSMFLTLLFGYSSKAAAQGLEYEVGIGPQMTKAIITGYSVGIIGDNKPSNDRFPIGYAFNLMVRNTASPWQIGLQLKNDYTRFNVYLPVQFPSDFNAKKSSRWNNYYEAFRLGIGGHIRHTFNNSFVQTGVSYLSELSRNSRSSFFLAAYNSFEDTEGEDYSKGAGMIAEILIGSHVRTRPVYQLNVSMGIQYSFYEQEYAYELYIHNWTVRPINCFLMLSYQFTNSGK